MTLYGKISELCNLSVTLRLVTAAVVVFGCMVITRLARASLELSQTMF
jgi:hypothetical protein